MKTLEIDPKDIIALFHVPGGVVTDVILNSTGIVYRAADGEYHTWFYDGPEGMSLGTKDEVEAMGRAFSLYAGVLIAPVEGDWKTFANLLELEVA